MGACDQADGMKRKELPLLTRVNLFCWVNFNLTRDKKYLTLYIVVQKIVVFKFLL